MSVQTTNRPSSNVGKHFSEPINAKANPIDGIFLCRVVFNSDEQYNGRFMVELLHSLSFSNTASEPSQLNHTKTVLPLSPFGGTTNSRTATDNKQYSTSQTTFGMAPQAPPIGATVLVAFIKEQSEGFYLGSLFDKDRNYSMPGLAHAEITKENKKLKNAPSSELNPNTKDMQEGIRAPHPSYANVLEAGLGADYIRGLSSSGMRRDTINQAFGFKTQSGHTITMDDGGASGTDASIRIRTAQGAQILLHDEAATIYIANAVGSGYVEIDNAGHIDVYGKMFSVHAEEAINFKSGGDFNVEANRINMKSLQGGIKVESATGKIEMHSATDVTISADQNGNLNFASGNLKATAQRIDWNGPPADKAEKPFPLALAQNKGVKESVASRVPEHEPWGGRDTFAAPSAIGSGTR